MDLKSTVLALFCVMNCTVFAHDEPKNAASSSEAEKPVFFVEAVKPVAAAVRVFYYEYPGTSGPVSYISTPPSPVRPGFVCPTLAPKPAPLFPWLPGKQ